MSLLTPAGTVGAAPITLNVVTDAGARGDGISDDTAAFQSALGRFDATGGTLVVPAGTYKVQPGILQIPGNVTLSASQATLRSGSIGFSLLDLLGSNITVSGLTIDGANLAVRGMTIRAGSTNVSLTNDVLQNFTQPSDPANGLFNELPTGIRIEGNGDGITIDSSTVQNVVAINTNGPAWPHKVARGIWIAPGAGQTTSKNITIKNSTFSEVGPKDDGDCIVIQDSSAPANLTIANNTFNRCHKRAIKIQTPGASITGNHITNPFLGNNPFDTFTDPFPFDMYSAISVYASNVLLDSNTVDGIGSFYVGLELGGGSCTPLTGITVGNNSVTMGSGSVLTGASSIRAISAVDGLSISNNHLDYAQTAIDLHPAVANASVTGNTFGANITSQFQYYGTPPCPVQAPVVPAPPTQAVGIPAYFAPGATWTQLNAGAPTVGMAVMNPSNGPGPAVNFDYVNQVQQSRAKGLVVLGYVHTSYGQRSTADVKREVDEYYAWYDVDGIFFDEASTDCAVQPYYTDLNNYVKAKSGLARTVLNPGTATNECYMTAADTIVTFEGTYNTYFSNYSAPSWTSNYPPNRFWHLVYGVAAGNEARMQYVIAQSKLRGAGWVFVTTADVPNPWGSLPIDPFWSDELAAARATTSVVDLNALIDPSVQVFGLNNGGQVVGMLSDAAGNQHGFVLRGSTVATLPNLSGGSVSVARAINDAGEIAGESYSSNGQRAVVWTPSGAITDLGTLPGSTYSTAYGINAAGQVVGSSTSATNSAVERAVLWSPGAAPSDLGTLPGGTGAVAMGINAMGHVVGSAVVGGADHAFVWTTGAGMTDVGSLGGSSSDARAINAAGQIVGQADTASGTSHAFFSNGVMNGDLGVLPGGNSSIALGVNSMGEAVGRSFVTSQGAPPPPVGSTAAAPVPSPTPQALRPDSQHAFIYSGSAMSDMNALLPAGSAWLLTAASAINDHGQAVGQGLIGGTQHAFLMFGLPTASANPPLTTPVPAPNPVPSLSSIAPESAQAGGVGVTLTVSGSGFVNGSIVEWNGSPRPTTYASATQLAASIPATDIAAVGTAHVSVSTPAPGGGTTTTMPFLVTANNVSVTAVQTSSSTSPSGSVFASVGGSGPSTPGSVSVSGTGAGVVSVAQYSADPGLAPTFDGTGGYLDVNIAPGSALAGLTLVDCNLNGGTSVYWFDGTAWQRASDQTAGPGSGCVTVHVTSTSVPSLSQLTGTPFAAGTPPRITAAAATSDGQSYASGVWTRLPVTVTFSCLPASLTTVTPPRTVSSEGANQLVSGTCTDKAGDSVSTTFSGIDIDRTPPTVAASPGPGARLAGGPAIAINATITVESSTAAVPGTLQPVTCWNSRGVVVGLDAIDNSGGSGLASINYSATGAQLIASSTASSGPLSVPIATTGVTTLTYTAADRAGNAATPQSLTILVGATADSLLFACAAPAPAFSLPAHGSLVVNGQATYNGFSVPFQRIVPF